MVRRATNLTKHFPPDLILLADTPHTADCYVTVARAPKCADQSWVYCYDPESDAKIGFCCLESWTCIVEKDSSGNSLGVGCDPPNERIASTQSQASTSLTAYEIPGATSSSTAASTSGKVTKTTSTAPATSSPTSANTDSSSGLSTGAKAGIGVGAVIAGLALIGVVVWLLLLFKKREDRVASSAGDSYPQSPPGYGAAKVAPTSAGDMSSVHHDPRELDATVHRGELEGDQAAHEMGNNSKWR